MYLYSCALRSAVALGCVLAVAAVYADERPTIAVRQADGQAVIAVEGLADEVLSELRESTRNGKRDLDDLLRVYVGEEPPADRPAVLGSVSFQDDALVFRPRFSLKAGMAYRVVFLPSIAADADTKGTPATLEQVVRLEERDAGDAAVVRSVYPSGDVLPENLLKYYVHFSAPMSQGEAYEHVRLLDAQGDEVEFPFVNVGQELWDRSGTRITLLLDPGRIKRGLRPREEVGPILEEGQRYELVIDRAWRDAHGRPLADELRKKFRVDPPDDVQPSPTKWRITSPAAGTSEPLTIRFEEPLDHAMLQSAFAVLTARQTPLSGTIQVDDAEMLWRFVPRDEWTVGNYLVVVDTSLEDRSGNSIERPFEVDVFEKVQAEVVEKRISLPLRIR